MPEPGNPQTLNRYSYANNNPVVFNDPSGHMARRGGVGGHAGYPTPPSTPPIPTVPGAWTPVLGGSLLQMTQVYSETYYAIPWQITAGVLESEMYLDTGTMDFYETWAFRGAPRLTMRALQALGGADPGPGLGNIHLSTARVTSAYFAANYPDQAAMQLGFESLTDAQLAQRLSWDDENIRTAAAIVRMLADYRYGSGFQPSSRPPANLGDWGKADGAAIWHGYRYGVPGVTPGDGGFTDIYAFQRRDLSVSQLLGQGAILGTGATDSVYGSFAMFDFYFAQR